MVVENSVDAASTDARPVEVAGLENRFDKAWSSCFSRLLRFQTAPVGPGARGGAFRGVDVSRHGLGYANDTGLGIFLWRSGEGDQRAVLSQLCLQFS